LYRVREGRFAGAGRAVQDNDATVHIVELTRVRRATR
jgi:hypothetical protein